jgi:hypothetical protein
LDKVGKSLVWKASDDDHYLLDFTQDVAEAWGPFRDSSTSVLQEVFNDLKGRLIIDGQQTTRLSYRCQVLLACSAKKDNFKESSKSDDCKKFYYPVWTEEEIGEFCDDFGEHGSKFSEMCVPDKEEALRLLKELGGVPRYVLTKNSEEGLQQRNEALESLSTANCLSFFIGNFHDETRKDSLIHIETDDGYESRKFDFASKSVRKAVERHLLKVGSADVVAFFRQHIDSGIYGNVLGSLYERVAHVILVEGGSFNGKKVFVGGGHEDVEFQFEKFSIQEFEDVKELFGIRTGTYCIPTSSNFQSVDAVVLRDVLL